MPLISKAFSNLITFSRTGGAATYFAANGVLTTAANNEPRFDYDPATFLPRGLLIEEQRTNSIRNNTMVGAVAGTPGTPPTNWNYYNPLLLSTQVVGTGVSNGITYVDIRVFGTAASSNILSVNLESTVFISASIGQTWTASVWTALVGGTTTNVSNVQIKSSGRDATNELGATATNLPLTGTLVRSSATRTFTSAATIYALPYIAFNLTAGAIDITLRIGLPQLEQGAFATSVIPTTTTALTRSQDRAVINTLSPWYNATTGTIYAEFAVTQPASGGNQFLARFSDNSYNNQIGDFINTTGFVGISTASGGVFDGLAATAVVVSANTITKAAGAYATNDLAAVKDGGAVATDNTATIPSGLIRFDLGSDHGGLNNIKAGYLRRITYYPTRLSNAQLQTITT